MTDWKRAGRLGLMSWLIPFAAGFALFPLKRSNAPLFGVVMGLVVLVTAATLLRACFRGGVPGVRAAIAVGGLWLAINLICDYPMFAFGPMKMTAGAYYSEIGVGYVAFPLFAWGAARMARP
jgi:hypothetical protein